MCSNFVLWAMGNYKNKQNIDRYLYSRNGVYNYVRRVPSDIAASDSRSPNVRISLKTTDLAEARIKRDSYEQADDMLWDAMRRGGGATSADRAMYEAAVKRAEALGIEYRDATQFTSVRLPELVRRFELGHQLSIDDPAAPVVAGLIPVPAVTFSEVAAIYFNEITPHEVVFKSKKQREHWRNVKERAVASFIDVVGDLPLSSITRDHANKFYKHWLDKVAPKNGLPTHSASSGNRHIGNIRVIIDAYYKHIGQADTPNPLQGLSFSDPKDRQRPPFSVEWIRDTILKPGSLSGLNDEARGIVLALIETGARPSEICNIVPEHIFLNDEVPHILIKPRLNSEDPREIKTRSSIRTIPLVGVSLAAFQKHSEGFPRYKDKEDSLSAVLNKYFKANGLFPTTAHKIYSFRHAFEDRMKDAGIDDELRRILMGHSIDRPKYGSGGSLKWRINELEKIKLPFDPVIV